MVVKSEYMKLLNEITQDVSDVVTELITEEVMPLLKEREKTEKTIGNKAIKEMFELEQEAR